jgi:hypothetical protein
VKGYTAHLKPGHPPVLVREGFSWGAWLLGPFWRAAHRAWVPAGLLGAVTLALWALAPLTLTLVVGFGLGWLSGLLGQDLRRWSLARRGFVLSHVLSARDEETALGRLLTFRPDIAAGLAPLGLAFVDVLHADPAGELVQKFRSAAAAPTIVNTGFGSPTVREEAVRLIEAGHGDAVAIGRAVIANPDLVERWTHDTEQNNPDPATFYVGGPRGYIDYPTSGRTPTA